MDRNYSNSLQSAIKAAASMARARSHASYGVPHMILSLLAESSGTGLANILASMGQDVGYILEWFDTHLEMYTPQDCGEEDVVADSQISIVLDEAERSKIKLGAEQIDALCVFLATVRQGVVLSDAQIETLGISENDILDFYDAQEINFSYQGEENKLLASIPYCYTLKSEEYVQQGAIVLGREKEVRTILENLERSAHKAIMLVGGTGVGKTAIIHALTKEVCENKDELISQTTLIGIHTAKLLASVTGESELAQKISSLLGKLDALDGQTVLVIDDLQVLLEFGNNSKAATLVNILNAQISEGATTLVFSITPDAFRKHIEKHPIESKLEVLEIKELDRLTLLSMVRRHANIMEQYYGLRITDDATQEALTLSTRYFKEKSQPAAAIDLLDTTTASARLSNKNAKNELAVFRAKLIDWGKKSPINIIQEIHLLHKSIVSKISVILTSKLSSGTDIAVDEDSSVKIQRLDEILQGLEAMAENGIEEITPLEIDAIVAEATGIPIGKIQAEEKDRLLGIDRRLGERVKGQQKAITTLSDAIIESRSGLSDPRKPIGSFFFLGPTGTGKTELAKSLAELLFDDENAMIRFDMSEFKEEHSAALLYGAPPGYVGYEEGGLLVTKIRQKPYSVVLFDEIEKAHASVYDVFLQMMDEGKIHDKLGREGDFSNSIIIFTSNIGSSWIAEQFQAGKIPASNQLIEVMSSYFRPEFLGRLTEVVPFAPISEQIATSIFLLHFSRLQKQLAEQKNISVELDSNTIKYLTGKGYSSQYGARPIAGVIRSYLKKTISRLIVAEQIREGDKVLVTCENNELRWMVQDT